MRNTNASGGNEVQKPVVRKDRIKVTKRLNLASFERISIAESLAVQKVILTMVKVFVPGTDTRTLESETSCPQKYKVPIFDFHFSELLTRPQSDSEDDNFPFTDYDEYDAQVWKLPTPNYPR